MGQLREPWFRATFVSAAFVSLAAALGAQSSVLAPPQNPVDAQRLVPPAPKLDPYTAITSLGRVVITGEAMAARDVRVSGPTGTLQVAVTNGAFSAMIPLAPNQKNKIFFTSLSYEGIPGPPAPATVTQDSTPPQVFIDYPPEGLVATTDTTAVAGRVSDQLSGFMGLTVTVNGAPADVDVGIGTNGTFLLKNVPLTLNGMTTLSVAATDFVGNQGTDAVTVENSPASGPAIVISGGDGQAGNAGGVLPLPLEVHVTKSDGSDFAGKTVTFDVMHSNGMLSATFGGAQTRSLQVQTDAGGLASAYFSLGSDAGCGNNRVTATSRDISGTIFFCHTALPAFPAQINVGSGNDQRGEVGAPLPDPLQSWVNDGCNGIANVLVTYSVDVGTGLVNGGRSADTMTSETGHAEVTFEPGPGVNIVRADYMGNPGRPASFFAMGLERDLDAPTTFAGTVLDNARQPIEGAVCRIYVDGIADQVVSGPDGRFFFDSMSIFGPGELEVLGGTATMVGGMAVPQGSFPTMNYATVITKNAHNEFTTPILLPRLEEGVLFDNIKDIVLTLEGIEGLEMVVKSGSMTLADGTVPDPTNPVFVSLSQVHHDDIPMPMPDGVAPPFAWTLQPKNATFDPPVEIRYPNMTGLPPGAVSYFLSYDHDLESFSIVATGAVSEDGSTIVSDPGSGIFKAGWGCNCPPYAVAGDCRDCEPKSNGCGSQSDSIPDFVPDFYWCALDPFVTADFANGVNGPCDNHDFCWGTCHNQDGVTQFDCDLQFLVELSGVCLSTYLPGPCLNGCLTAAGIYFLGVEAAGSIGGLYGDSQDAVCDCVKGGGPAPGHHPGPSFTPDEVFEFLGVPPILDEDGDLMPDDWEALVGLDPTDPTDAFEDPDLDELFNVLEFIFQYDPFDPDTDDDGTPDGEQIDALAPELAEVILGGWTVIVNGQSAVTGPYGTFRVGNIAAPDQFGPGGPGTSPDFLSDDAFRATFINESTDEPLYGFSEFFQIQQGVPFDVSSITITDVPPLSPASLAVSIESPFINVLTTLGDTTQVTTIATLADGSEVDVTPATSWTTYLTSNPNVASVDSNGLVTATGKGIAYITAKNDGATAVTTVLVSPDDPLTTVEGFVLDDMDMGFAGVDVTISLTGATVQTDSEGFYSIANVPSDLGIISVVALYQNGSDVRAGFALDLTPRPGGITDAGIIRLVPAVFWAVDADGSWNDGANWNTGVVPTATDNVVISRPNGLFTITHDGGANACMSIYNEETLTFSAGSLTLSDVLVSNNTVNLTGGTIAGGDIQVNGAFNLTSGRIEGSKLLPGSGGQGPTATGNAATLDGVVLEASLSIPNVRTINVENGLEVNGSVILSSVGSFTALDMIGQQELGGTGEIVFAGTSANNRIRPNGGTLTIGHALTVRGRSGTVGDAGENLLNQGNIIADEAGGVITVTGAMWLNQCFLRAKNGGTVATEGSWTNQAEFVVRPSSALNLGGTFVFSDTGSIVRSGNATINLTGTLQNAGSTLALDASTGSWTVLGGKIEGGTVTTAGGFQLIFSSNQNNELDGVTLGGDVDMTQVNGANFRVSNGLTLNGTLLIGAPSANVYGYVRFVDSSTLMGTGTVVFGQYVLNGLWPQTSGTTLTIGPGITVRGDSGRIGYNPNLGGSTNVNVVNQGMILADTDDGPIEVRGADFTNTGNLAVTAGGAFSALTTTWTNTGTMSVKDSTMTLEGTWANTGLLSSINSVLNLGGFFTLGTLGTFSRNGGVVNLTGTLDNTGTTLALDGATGSWTVLGGKIVGGNVTRARGAELVFSTNSNNELDGVTLDGDVNLTQVSGSNFRVSNGLTLNGTLSIGDPAANVYGYVRFVDSSTLMGTGTVVFGQYIYNSLWPQSSGTTLTIGPNITVRGESGRIGHNPGLGGSTNVSVVNQGTILAELDDGPIEVRGANFTNNGVVAVSNGGSFTALSTTWTNAGTVSVTDSTMTLEGAWTNTGMISSTNSTLNLGGTFTLPDLGNFVRSGGAVNLTGTLDNTGTTLALDAMMGSWTVLGGKIVGGNVTTAGGAELVFSTNSNNELDGVTLDGDINLTQASGANFRASNGLTLNGTLSLGAPSANVYGYVRFLDSTPLSGTGTVVFGQYIVNGLWASVSGTTLTIGPGITVRGDSGRIGYNPSLGGSANVTVVNEGTILAELDDGPIEVHGADFTNNGVVAVSNGGSFSALSTAWTNAGTMSATNATMTFGGDWLNAGMVTSTDSTLNLGGTFMLSDLGSFIHSGTGTVNLTGVLDNTATTLALDATTGSWTVLGGTIVGGNVTTTGGAELIFSTNTSNQLDGVTLDTDVSLTGTSGRNFRVVNGLVLNGTLFIGDPGANVYGYVRFLDSSTISGTGTVVFGQYIVNGLWNPTAGTTLTIGPNITVRGDSGRIGYNPSLGGSTTATVVNQGSIEPDTGSGPIEVRGGDFTNSNQVVVTSGSSFSALSTTWTNAGTMSVTDSVMTFGGDWTNAGMVTATDSTLNLDGTFVITDLGSFVHTGTGGVNLTGTLDNTGSTLALDASTGSWTVVGGTILGGNVTTTGGAELLFSTNANNLLDGVTLDTDVSLTQTSGTQFRVVNGLVLNGTLAIGDPAANVYGIVRFNDSSTVSGTGAVVFGQYFINGLWPTVSGTTLTIGPGITVRGDSGRIGYNPNLGGSTNVSVLNQGTIDADLASGPIEVRGQVFTNDGIAGASNGGALSILSTGWSNNATLSATDATLNLGGTFNTSDVGTQTGTNSTVNLTGTLDNTGSTLALDASTGAWTVAGGTIVGGNVTASGGAELLFTTSGNNELDGVTLDTDVSLTQTANTRFQVVNGLTLNATLTIGDPSSNAYGVVRFNDSSSLSGTGTVVFGQSITNGLWPAVASTTLTIGPSITVRGENGRIGHNPNLGGSTNVSVVTQGTIDADVPGGDVEVRGQSFTNEGTAGASGGGAFGILSTDWSNTGTLSATDSVLELGGTFTTAGLGTQTATNSTVNLTGTLDNTGDTLALDAATGSWTVLGGTILGGNVTATGGAELLFSTNTNNELDGVTLDTDVSLIQVSGTQFRVVNGLTLNGTLAIGDPSANVWGVVRILDSSTLSGTGSVVFGQSIINGLWTVTGGTTITIGPDVTVRGDHGRVGYNPALGGTTATTILNHGTIEADVAAGLIEVRSADFTSSGSLSATNGATLSSLSSWTNTGTLVVDASSTMSTAGDLIQQGGSSSIALGGGSISTTGTVDVQDGVLGGTGTVSGDLLMAGDLHPGGLGVAGTLAVTGAYEQTAMGVLFVELGGTGGGQFDSLATTGTATFDGILDVSTIGGYTAVLADMFDVATFASSTGTFTINSNVGAGLGVQATYDPTALNLEIVTMP